MKQIFTILLVLGLTNCKEATKQTKPVEKETVTEEVSNAYPKALNKVFDAHGGLNKWKSKRTLNFELVKPDGNEKHTIDLYSRQDKVEIPPISLGFDGSNVWLQNEQMAYRGNAALYHNLMFYFYAMPFVLADSGINYSETEDLVFEGKSYPGIQISFDDGVGASSKDDYFLHYDPETYEMAWLGYTFTFGKEEKSDKLSFIRYNDWANINGVKLPKSITWHVNEGKTIQGIRKTALFESITLDETSKPDTFYVMPENAKVILMP
ncbi:hypothetical protein D9O36_08440 [Zobellia amurskyensis]|uniref:Threonine synthase n=1 Tax=Zobellia amurskyensis TaxID=248905 RepID=A0A7X2ZT20_9FLAO|nr:DUF6503 family protein [Zobellia amurskyensis]MUH35865.1 hypothetical protein [Zobellia amurskyensis]